MLPGIEYQQIAVTAEVNPEKLLRELGAVAGMEPRPDDLENLQAVYQLELAEGGGYTLSFPAAVAASVVGAVIAAHNPAVTPTPDEIEAAWRDLRIIRDAWLSACQVIFDELKAPGVHDMPAEFSAALAEHADDWIAWRTAMRNLPATPGVDPVVAVEAARAVDATDRAWPEPWPTPPAAPVIYIRGGGGGA